MRNRVSEFDTGLSDSKDEPLMVGDIVEDGEGGRYEILFSFATAAFVKAYQHPTSKEGNFKLFNFKPYETANHKKTKGKVTNPPK